MKKIVSVKELIIPGYVDMREPQYDLLEIWSKYLMF